jgi:hypothetical protein
MLATVRANCPTCGDIELTVRQLRVQTCTTTGESTYSLLCPSCRLIVNKPAEQRVVELLISAGVPMVRWAMPAELYELKLGPPITYDDLLEFHFQLENANWFEQVLRR